MLRSTALLLVAFGLLPLAFVSPFVGVLLWTWVSLMSPQELVWGFVAGIRWGVYIGGITIVAWMFSNDRKIVPFNAFNILVVIFTIWMGTTTVFALVPDGAEHKWDYVVRVMIQVLISSALMTTRIRIHAMIWMIVISVGYYGFKGGLFTVLTGGQFEVIGPAASGIEDRNHLALALAITLPLIFYLHQQSENAWVRRGLVMAMALDVFAIVGTYSRGGLVALAAVLGVMFMRSRAKFAMAAFVVLATPAAFYFMPEEWWERMASIREYEEDNSAQGRLTIWRVCFQIGLSSIFGGGFVANIYGHVVSRFDPTVAPRAAHSIYFEVFAEHGVIGFAIWTLIMIVGLANARWLVRASRRRPDLAWASDFGRMAQAAMAAFLVGGAFLSLGYWIQTFLILAVLAASCRLVRSVLRDADQTERLAPPTVAIAARAAILR